MAVMSGRHGPGSVETASIPNTRSLARFPEWYPKSVVAVGAL